MVMNPNVLMDLTRLRNEELLVAAERARLARSAAPDQHSPLEPPPDVQWRRSTA
jgi:hypothetical protein